MGPCSWVCQTWREVALEAAALWSSVIIWRRLVDNFPPLEVQLDRAHGAPLDMFVSCYHIHNNNDLEEMFRFVLSKTKAIKKLRIGCHDEQQKAIVERFIKDGASELEWLSISFSRGNAVSCEWNFSPDASPCLRHLALAQIVPMAGAPLSSLVCLSLSCAYDLLQLQDSLTQKEALVLGTRIHRFLAACPNLESLKMNMCFSYPEDYNADEQPIIPLLKLRYLTLKDHIFQIAQTLGSLRLHPSASFHLFANDLLLGDINGDYLVRILPRNISQTLAPIRHTHHLSLTVGNPRTHLSLHGTTQGLNVNANTDVIFDPESDPEGAGSGEWSITLPDLTFSEFDLSVMQDLPADFLRLQAADPERAKFYFLGLTARRVLARIPHLVVPAHLVELQLHLACGLPIIAHDWACFFATMPRLCTLGIGGGAALIAAVLKTLNTYPGLLCGELRYLTLCAPYEAGCGAEKDPLGVFLREVVGGWVRERARAGAGLRSLTVWIFADSDGSADGLGLHARCGGGGRLTNSDGEAVGFVEQLRGDIAFLEDSVGGVMVETTDCGACGAEYELPEGPPEFADDGSDSDDPYFY